MLTFLLFENRQQNLAQNIHALHRHMHQFVRGYWISDPVQVHSGPQTPLYIPPHRRGLRISEPSLDLPTT